MQQEDIAQNTLNTLSVNRRHHQFTNFVHKYTNYHWRTLQPMYNSERKIINLRNGQKVINVLKARPSHSTYPVFIACFKIQPWLQKLLKEWTEINIVQSYGIIFNSQYRLEKPFVIKNYVNKLNNCFLCTVKDWLELEAEKTTVNEHDKRYLSNAQDSQTTEKWYDITV